MTICERIQQVRKYYRLSRRAFGDQLGVSENVIVNIEMDRLKRPEQKEPIYKLICEKFRISDNWLRTGEGEMFQTLSEDEEFDQICAEIQMSDDEFIKSIIQAYWKLPETKKAVVRELIDSISANKKSGGDTSGNN